jgi:predicted transcriptional regulator
MAMTLRLTEEETERLRMQAEREHRSMHEVARLAINDRVNRASRSDEILAAGRLVKERDAEALRLLAE